ncbi:hypothetical protein A2U01_0117972, partial [Trifolium medium]|nr:hypothetical protein [Trifolium medium]
MAFVSEEKPDNDDLSEAIALISKEFNKTLSKLQAQR